MFKKILNNNRAKAALLILLSASQFAAAQSFGDIANNASGQFNYIGIAIQGFFGLCGLVCIGMSIFTLITYNKTQGQGAKLSTFAIYLIGGGCLFYIASLVQTTGDSVWGNGGGDRSRVTIQR
ncbi:hypothetical protein [Chromobacterium haemolyticum]|uniref:hypothetical protein n=1 Tax=Chromobacterium haemolyticum TaxID=394935 RepID=UPI0024497494|nr:hypothetical protein [Chromobacterium haemolyticum]MDH0342007.1 hypothetical protein [Chromobacterium haemolyticum]